MEFEPFDPSHLTDFDPDSQTSMSISELASADLECLIGARSWTGFVGPTPVVCAGLQEVWPGRCVAWSILSRAIGAQNFLAVDRRVRKEFRNARETGTRRIEATVDPYYPEGRALRWALALGFHVEGYMRCWDQIGRDMCIVAITGEVK